MAFLSQASHLGSLLLPHDAFQEYAAHPAEWSAALNSNGSERTCIRSGLATFLHCAFTAHSNYVVEHVPAHRKPPDVDLDIEEPVSCRYSPTFHFYATVAGMLGTTLIGSRLYKGTSSLRNACWFPSGWCNPFIANSFRS